MNKFEIVKEYKQTRPLDFLKSLRDNPEIASKEKLLALIKEMIKLISKQRLQNLGKTILGYLPGIKTTEEEFKYEDSKAFYNDMKRVFENLNINDRYFKEENLERYEILKQFIGEEIINKNVQISDLGSFFIDDKKYGVISDLEMQKFFSRINKEELETLAYNNFSVAKTNGFYIVDADNKIYQQYLINAHKDREEIEQITNDEDSSVVLYHGIAFDKDTQTIIKVYPDLVDDLEMFNNGRFNIPKEIEGIKVENIGEKAFWGFGDELRKVIVPELNGNIGKGCFGKNDYLEDVLLPTTLTEIPDYCFYKCPALINVVIPETVTKIGEFAFHKDDSLVEIKFPDDLKTIGESAFEGCTNLSNTKLNKEIERIDDRAFYNTGLNSISIPETTVKVGNKAFAECPYLAHVTLNSTKGISPTAFLNSRVENVSTPNKLPNELKENLGKDSIETKITIKPPIIKVSPDLEQEIEEFHNVIEVAEIPETKPELYKFEELTSLEYLFKDTEQLKDDREEETTPKNTKSKKIDLER